MAVFHNIISVKNPENICSYPYEPPTCEHANRLDN
jgi:hypothetical protein